MGWSDDVKTVDLNLEVVVQACILIPGLAQTEEEFKDTLGYKLKPSLRKKNLNKTAECMNFKAIGNCGSIK